MAGINRHTAPMRMFDFQFFRSVMNCRERMYCKRQSSEGQLCEFVSVARERIPARRMDCNDFLATCPKREPGERTTLSRAERITPSLTLRARSMGHVLVQRIGERLPMRLLRYLFWVMLRCGFALRYRLRLHGMEQVRGLRGPVLILPNHPGYVDPPLVFSALWPALKPRPMAFDLLFRNPILRPVAKLLNALRIPDVDAQASAQTRDEAQSAVNAVIEGLKKGENFILWPSGRIQRQGVELLGGSRALTEILKAVPDATIVLVRTNGVWGSMFSFAQTGKHPELTKLLFIGLGLLFANLIFFSPRRRVDITVEKLDRSKLPELKRETINPWFENWYNSGGQPEPVYVPYHFLFGPRQFEFPQIGEMDDVDP